MTTGKVYLYDGEGYDTLEDCIRAIVESTYEYDDGFWDWLDATHTAGEMYSMVVEMLNDFRTRARAEDFRTGLLDEYAETVCGDEVKVDIWLDAFGVEIEEE